MIAIALGCASQSIELELPDFAEPIEDGAERTKRPPAPAPDTSRGAAPTANDPRAWIPVETDVGDPRAVTGMTVRVHIDAPFRLPSGPNHLVDSLPFELTRIRIRAAPGARVGDDERVAALAADASFDADTAELRAAAERATAGAGDDRARVAALVAWVHAHVSYAYRDEPRASAVLAAAEGDCSEISTLFVAMARALRIPARRVVGLAFTYADGAPAFGYHAWAEVELGGRWVQVDPTWNEPLADATHIKLAEGETDAWHAAAGHIEIWVGDVQRRGAVDDIDPADVAAELPAHLRLRFPPDSDNRRAP